MRIIVLGICIFILCQTCLAKIAIKNEFYVSPGITVGYTFKGGFNYGIDLDIGAIEFDSKFGDVNTGISISFYRIHTYYYKHCILSGNLLIKSNYVQVKFGLGDVWYRWGYENKNRCSTTGVNFDVAVSTKSNFTPWIGYKKFMYSDPRWFWRDTAYKTGYVKYSYPICIDCMPDQILQNLE